MIEISVVRFLYIMNVKNKQSNFSRRERCVIFSRKIFKINVNMIMFGIKTDKEAKYA